MPRGDRPPGRDVNLVLNSFLHYLEGENHPDIIKRDELREIYVDPFRVYQRSHNPTHPDIPFRFVLKVLRYDKVVHELGDYFSFGKDVQALYEQLLDSQEHKNTLEEWRAIAKENPYFCEVCGVDCTTEKNLEDHKNGHRHRIHKFHYELCNKREPLMSCPDGLEINSDPAVCSTTFFIEKQSSPNKTQHMLITIKNTSHENILIFRRHLFLWDTGVFRLVKNDNRNHPVPRNRNIQPGSSCEIAVKCKAPSDFGHHFVPLAFYFGWKTRSNELIADDGTTEEFVLRFVAVHVLGDLHDDLAPTAPFVRHKPIPDCYIEDTVPGVPLPKSAKSILSKEYKLGKSHVPPYLQSEVRAGLTHDMGIVNNRLRRELTADLNLKTYKSKFDTLLWTEELQMQEDIKHYDLIAVTLDIERRGNLMVLQVPDLMERRPSILRGDKVYIFYNDNKSVRYETIVHNVRLDEVHLGVAPRLRNHWMAGLLYDVRFDFIPFNLWVQHRALTDFHYAQTILFPAKSTTFSPREGIFKPWFDRKLNPEQQTAVTNIVKGTNRPGPYLIFGPPGTGKTVTVTEAIRQVYHCQPDAKILVCCPENSAADFVTRKLINQNQPGTVQMADIVRMYAVSRPYESVPIEIKDSKRFNYDETDGDFFYPSKNELKKIKILVVTLSSAGRLVSAAFPKNHFTHIFIDEAAHAIEPECIVPITGLMDCRNQDCGQLVLAGDPRQLGPILRSQFSQNFGLDVSLLERIMRDCEGYQRSEVSGYDPCYITKLVRNYRSHDSILEVPRALFYDGELQCCGDPMILDSMLSWGHLPNKKVPIIFHAVFGNDEREASSPSFFNRDEIAQVEKYLDLLLNEKKKGLKINPKDIGIIAPYRKQVQKLREMIKKKNFGKRGEMMVGSVEEFQGQENKIIILSAVRSSDNYMEIDMACRLGFVRNPKRFNVALTRARSLLIVIGNPLLLEKDPCWKRFLDYCDTNGCFIGQHGKSRPSNPPPVGSSKDNEVLYDREASARLQTEDAEFEIRN